MLRLASTSTTRAKILKDANVAFKQEATFFDEESIEAKTPKEFVYKATMGKYETNLKAFGIDDMPLLVADTIVCKDNTILRKAKDINDAKKLLLAQSNSNISIISCMIFHSHKIKLIDISQTIYKFDNFKESDLSNYLNSMEWENKAGGCMVEGWCKKYIISSHGYESTAMGLNVELLKRFI